MLSYCHRRRSSVNFRGIYFARKKCVCKINQMPEFYMILARINHQNTLIFVIFAGKINKIPEFLHDFCSKNARILHNNCPKFFFIIFSKHVPPAPSPRFLRLSLLLLECLLFINKPTTMNTTHVVRILLI